MNHHFKVPNESVLSSKNDWFGLFAPWQSNPCCAWVATLETHIKHYGSVSCTKENLLPVGFHVCHGLQFSAVPFKWTLTQTDLTSAYFLTSHDRHDLLYLIKQIAKHGRMFGLLSLYCLWCEEVAYFGKTNEPWKKFKLVWMCRVRGERYS